MEWKLDTEDLESTLPDPELIRGTWLRKDRDGFYFDNLRIEKDKDGFLVLSNKQYEAETKFPYANLVSLPREQNPNYSWFPSVYPDGTEVPFFGLGITKGLRHSLGKPNMRVSPELKTSKLVQLGEELSGGKPVPETKRKVTTGPKIWELGPLVGLPLTGLDPVDKLAGWSRIRDGFLHLAVDVKDEKDPIAIAATELERNSKYTLLYPNATKDTVMKDAVYMNSNHVEIPFLGLGVSQFIREGTVPNVEFDGVTMTVLDKIPRGTPLVR